MTGSGTGWDAEWGQDGTERVRDGSQDGNVTATGTVACDVTGRGERQGHEKDGGRDRIVDGHADQA